MRPAWVLMLAFSAVSLATVSTVLAQPADAIGDILQKTEKPAAKTDGSTTTGAAGVATPAPRPSAKAAAAVAGVTGVKPAEVKVEPEKRPRYPIAILQALDKVTAESIRFEAPVGQPVKYHNLVFTVRSCEVTTEEEPERDAIAYVEIESRTPTANGTMTVKSVFHGWFYAAAPSVDPLQHPVYDAWLIACKA